MFEPWLNVWPTNSGKMTNSTATGREHGSDQITTGPIPMTLPDYDKTTNRYFRWLVWLKQAFRVLNKEGVISCPDTDVGVNGKLVKIH